MKLNSNRVRRLCDWLVYHVAWQRPPNFIIGSPEGPYLRRWHLIPRNPLCNVYLHQFLRSDDDRALHDHPWPSVSVLLHGDYWELSAHEDWGIKHDYFVAGDVKIRWTGKYAHRLEVDKPCWTLFITGPRYRLWGFHCPQGWVPWQEFTKPGKPGEIGRGCGGE